MASVITRRTFGKVLETCAFKHGYRYGDLTGDGLTAITGDKLTRLKQLVNDAVPGTQDIIVERGGMAKIAERTVVEVDAPITSGATVAVTKGSDEVTLSVDVISDSDVDRHIRLANNWFRIDAIADAVITLECNFAGTTITAGDLEIYSLYHKLATAGTKMVRMLKKSSSVIWNDGSPVKIVSADDIFDADPRLESTGATPSLCALVNYQGETRLLFWPIPNATTNFILRDVLQSAIMTADAGYPDLPEEFHLLWEAVAVWLVAGEFGTEDIVTAAALDVQGKLNTLGLKKKPEIDMYLEFDAEENVKDLPWFPARSLSSRVTTD